MTRRKWSVIAGAIVGGLLVMAGSTWWTWHSRVAAEPVLIKMVGIPAAADSNVQAMYWKPDRQAYYLDHVPYTTDWCVHFNWISKIFLRVPEKELHGLVAVEVTIGTKQRRYSRDEIERAWRRLPDVMASKGPALVVEVPNEGNATGLPWVPRLVNWPGDGAFFQAAWRAALGPLIVIALAALLLWDDTARWRFVVTGEGTAGAEPERGSWNWCAWVFLALSLAFLEWREPYYFTQDDNMDDCLPMVLVGCRNLWQGHWPDYNPYTFMGSPLASQGMYALTYPPTLMSYALARHALGDEYATVEVFAVLHVLAAFWAVRLLGRKVGMGGLCASAAGLSVSLSGAVLILGRGWFNFLPTTVWLAVLFLGLIELTRRPVGWRWLLGMGLAAAMPFHVGFSQLALYTHGFLAVATLYLLATGVLSWRRAAVMIPMWLVGAGLSLPLVYQQWQLARGMTRLAPPAEGIGQGWGAFYLPYPLVQANAPSGWGNVQREYMGSLYFGGGVLALCATLQVVGLLLYRPKKPQFGGLAWCFLAVSSFWLALGPAGGLWLVLERVPLVGFINRYPLRLLPFVAFFAAIAGGLVLQRILSEGSKTKQYLAAALIVLLGWQVVQSCTAFYVHVARPYSPLPSEFAGLLLPDGEPKERLASWAPIRSSSPEQALRMTQNISAVYGLPTLGGYNSLLEGNSLVAKSMKLLERKPYEGLRAYGVAWHFFAREGTRPLDIYSSAWWQEVIPQLTSLAAKVDAEQLVLAAETKDVILKNMSDADPLAFASSRQPLKFDLHGEGIDVDIRDLDGTEDVVVNFRWWPNMTASVDGNVVTCNDDDWGRMVVQLEGRGERLALRYRPDWRRGTVVGLAALAAGLLSFWVGRAVFMRAKVS